MDFLFRPEPIIWLQQILGYPDATPFRLLGLLGGPWGLLTVAAIALWFWGWRLLLTLIAAVTVEQGARTALVHLVSVPRPSAPGIVKFEHLPMGSFPSGHVSTAMVLWGLPAALGRLPWWPAAVVVALTGLSRLYLGVHYIADVVGAVVLAGAVIWATTRLAPRVRPWLEARPFGFWLAVAGVALAAAGAAFWMYVGTNHILWNAAGMIAGAAIALPVTYRWVGYRPGAPGPGRGIVKLAIGLSGIVALAALDLATGEGALKIGGVASFVAALWALLAAPLLFRLLGWSAAPRPEPGEPARRVGAVLAGITAAMILVGGWAAGIEPRLILDVEEEVAVVPGLPPAWEGARVGLFADVQEGVWLDNESMVREVAERIRRERPDVVLFAGDLVYRAAGAPRRVVDRAIEALAPLVGSGLPMFAVLGNHDWGAETDGAEPQEAVAAAVREGLRRAGFRLLDNEAAAVRAGRGAPLYIVGLGSAYVERDDPVRALAGVPSAAPRIVLMHNPSSFAELPARSAPFAVAGHTHGGQVRVPLLPEWTWLTFVRSDAVHADGWIDGFGAPGNRLYVNRGIGFSILPVRLNCPPELTLFTLTAGEGAEDARRGGRGS